MLNALKLCVFPWKTKQLQNHFAEISILALTLRFEAGLLRGWIIGSFGQWRGIVGGNEIGDYVESASSVVSCNVRIYGRDDISSERTRLCQEFVVRALARDRTGFARITCNCDLRKPTVSPSHRRICAK